MNKEILESYYKIMETENKDDFIKALENLFKQLEEYKVDIYELFTEIEKKEAARYGEILNSSEEAPRNSQEAGRKTRREMKEKAKEINAIMEIGNYAIFSGVDLGEAFAPGKIVKMGTLDPCYISRETGEITKYDTTAELIETGELETTKAVEVPFNALILMNTIMKNSVENPREELIPSENITFYVKGIVDAFTADPRGLLSEEVKSSLQDQQLTLERKTAGVLYLEERFKPLQELIGITPNGGRYSVLNYVGYDPETDTMTVKSPYLYQLWKYKQEEYFRRLRNLINTSKTNTKPTKNDMRPFETNEFFKGATYHEDPITFEIAVYITNTLLQAGYKGRPKTTEIKYRTLVNKCARLRERLAEIESKRGTLTSKGKPVNVTALYNLELKKIKRAFDLIQNPEKCDALKKYEFIDISPANKINDSYFDFIPPTKSLINDKLTIKWRKKTTD